MFIIFQGNDFYSFWQNEKTDSWAELTISKLRLKGVKIFWYEDLLTPPDLYRFDEDFNLITLKEVAGDEGSNLVDDEIYQAEAYSY